jgi:hypothetical protein
LFTHDNGKYAALVSYIKLYNGKCQWDNCKYPSFFVGKMYGKMYNVPVELNVHLCVAHYLTCECYISKTERFVV